MAIHSLSIFRKHFPTHSRKHGGHHVSHGATALPAHFLIVPFKTLCSVKHGMSCVDGRPRRVDDFGLALLLTMCSVSVTFFLDTSLINLICIRAEINWNRLDSYWIFFPTPPARVSHLYWSVVEGEGKMSTLFFIHFPSVGHYP